jgi:hypothetical protein
MMCTPIRYVMYMHGRMLPFRYPAINETSFLSAHGCCSSLWTVLYGVCVCYPGDRLSVYGGGCVLCAHMLIVWVFRRDAPAKPLSRLMVFWTNRVKMSLFPCIFAKKEGKNVVLTTLWSTWPITLVLSNLDLLLHFTTFLVFGQDPGKVGYSMILPCLLILTTYTSWMYK